VNVVEVKRPSIIGNELLFVAFPISVLPFISEAVDFAASGTHVVLGNLPIIASGKAWGFCFQKRGIQPVG
jgi:hypothetical protein